MTETSDEELFLEESASFPPQAATGTRMEKQRSIVMMRFVSFFMVYPYPFG